jgi:hypothetical protein
VGTLALLRKVGRWIDHRRQGVLLMDIRLCLLAAALVAGTAHAATPDAAQAGERCENAVSDTIKRMRGKTATEMRFDAAKRAITPGVGDELGVGGEGRYRYGTQTVRFTYSCAFDGATGETSGVVFREAGSAPAPQAHAAAWQPDLTHLSPLACESAVAAVLKDRHPRVGRIVFGSESRKLEPAANSRVGLEGQGAVQHAPGMNAVPFSYRCEIDPRDGRVLQAQANE